MMLFVLVAFGDFDDDTESRDRAARERRTTYTNAAEASSVRPFPSRRATKMSAEIHSK